MRSVLIADRVVPYAITRSPRARRLRVQVSLERGVEVVLPRAARLADAERILGLHGDWILRHIDRLARQSDAVSATKRRAVRVASFYGKEYALARIVVPAATPCLTVDEGALTLLVRGPSKEMVAGLLERWYRRRMRDLLKALVAALAARLGVTYGRIGVRAQKSRWGSCSPQGNLSFNWRLAKAPPQVLDYVIVHELMHRREMSHSPRFWRLVAEACPDFRRWRSWLRQHGLELSV